MPGLTVLSPHRDDAAFSLCLALCRWSKLNLPVTVVNFFTVSAYAPQSSATAIPDISAVREREDRRALASIDRRIQVETVGLFDAPIRLNISASRISALENVSLLPAGEIGSLSARIQTYFAGGRMVFVPLALGNHIDHLAVHAAAVKAHAGQRLGFYEDLPYATWVSEEQIAARLAAVESATRVALKPVTVRARQGVAKKLLVVSRYRSQVNREEAKAIAGYASRYGGGERVWVPKHGRWWRAVLERLHLPD